MCLDLLVSNLVWHCDGISRCFPVRINHKKAVDKGRPNWFACICDRYLRRETDGTSSNDSSGAPEPRAPPTRAFVFDGVPPPEEARLPIEHQAEEENLSHEGEHTLDPEMAAESSITPRDDVRTHPPMILNHRFSEYPGVG